MNQLFFLNLLRKPDCPRPRSARCGQAGQEPFAQWFLQKEEEISERLPNLVLVEHDLVVAPKFKLETLEARADTGDVVLLVDDGEEQNENWKLRVNLGEIVVAALIHEHQVIAES